MIEEPQNTGQYAKGSRERRFVHLFFLDGVGLGTNDQDRNPFVKARTPHLDVLLGRVDWYRAGNGLVSASRATLVPTDATLGVPGRPQSATGQATILSGRNVPRLVGEHYGPKPNGPIAEVISQGTLFDDVARAGGRAALLTPYPPGYFEAIASGKRLYSAVPLAVANAGWPLLTVEALRRGQAVSPDFTNAGWREFLGYEDIALVTPQQAGARIATLAQQYDFSFFEHWPSDRSGHRGSLESATAHLETIDTVIGGMMAHWPDDRGLLIITSDHGNIEEKDHRQHTLNPVPTILAGPGHALLAEKIRDLSDIAGVIRTFLEMEDKV
jgi:2,3-bisphosphoglycerate-independent phosphoglycerate mutase